MTSDERAQRLAVVRDAEVEALYRAERALADARRHGSWRWTPIGDELQFRSKALPTMPLDLTRTEAGDLLLALAKALDEQPPPMVRRSWLLRLRDWLARHTWNRSHEVERRYALQQMADEMRERGGW